MAANWNNPVSTSLYTDVLSTLKERDLDAATQYNNGTATNIPTGAIRWDGTLNRWQKWSGSAWAELTSGYSLTGLTVTSFSNTGNTTLGDSSADSVTVNASTWTFANATTIAGSVTFSGAVAYTGNVTFGDVAADTVTFIANSATVPAGGFTFGGGTVNFSVGLQVGGSAVVTAASTASLTNKTFNAATGGNVLQVNGNTVTAAAGSATVTLPAATDTLVGRETTDTLTNKTIGDTGTINASTAGFRGLPQNAKTAAYTLALTDAGKHISITTGGVTIPANSSVAFPVGTTIVVFNNSAWPQSITITTDTLRQAGTSKTGPRSMQAYGVATLIKVDTAVWVVTGNVT